MIGLIEFVEEVMAAQHTPGPWHVGKESVWKGNVYGPPDDVGTGGCIIASIHHTWPNAEANAQLIAAAPELLEALKQSLHLPNLLVRSYEDVDGSHQSAKTARQFGERYRALRAEIEAVIRKVEGQV